ncbi:transcription elongation factor 1 homolog [Scaptodrosophila lebanonensis]|uniref:Transcription elongation factor 1 homolog n=1 Tax=Drosophila lebanonensis TaxID=7225 RepID=A0A6J2T9E8_DROLE|nr:transcription elongation factor 1 homolog [Scaptodrosophila lebanonensis]
MGRRKSKRKPPPKRKAIMPLEQQFNCPFCNHERSCEVKMDKTRNHARIACRMCEESFQVSINYLSEPIDVYNEWIDSCEEANTAA